MEPRVISSTQPQQGECGIRLDQLWQDRDLAITTDFRDVFAECVTSHLGARDVSKVFPGYVYKQRLGFL